MPLRLKILYLPLRVFFALLYHQFAWTYDGVASLVSLGRWQTWVLAILPYLEGPNVLELGHGPGHLQAALGANARHSGNRYQVIGVDRSPQMGRIARKLLLQLGISPSLVNGYAQNLPFHDALFSQVVATFPTQYIADLLTLAEVWRVLLPGGKLVVLPVAWITGTRRLERLFAWLSRFTGQSPDWSEAALQPFVQAGFQVKAERLPCDASEILVIQAFKPLHGERVETPGN